MERDALFTLPEHLRSFLTITEVDNAGFLVGDLFQRKFAHPPPDFRRHLVALYRDADGACHLASYSHMRPFEDVYLSGGSCSNGETIRRMQPHEREAIQQAGGVWHLILKYAFERYADCCEGFIGYSNDARAIDVALASGFEKTAYPRLFAHWHKQLHEKVRRALVAKVEALGPF